MVISEIKAKIKRKVWERIKNHFYYERLMDSPVVLNLNYNGNPDQKKVLICYLTYGYFINWQNYQCGRTQPFEIFKIVSCFASLNYEIDIIECVDWRALNIVKSKKYDLIFGFGEAFYQMTNFQPDTTSILFMTENTPEFSYQQEKKRLDYFYERHKQKLKLERSGNFYKIYHLQKKYSHVITMGETSLLKNQYNNPYPIFPTGLVNSNYCFKDKNHLDSRLNFLWLGSRGAVHKGLDLLLDVFSKRDDIILHICGLNKEEKQKLNVPTRKNIIDYGRIDIKSDIFLEIVEKCSFLILPSCSEACSTSVTTGMLHGLIPVVIKDSGFNRLGSNAIFLEDYKIDYIDKKLNELVNIEPETWATLSRKVYNFAWDNFTVKAFENSFKSILEDILKTR